jgi:hypothetical protein
MYLILFSFLAGIVTALSPTPTDDVTTLFKQQVDKNQFDNPYVRKISVDKKPKVLGGAQLPWTVPELKL